jgi:hypothetical protein
MVQTCFKNERVPKQILNMKLKGRHPREQHGNNRLGKMSHRGRANIGSN